MGVTTQAWHLLAIFLSTIAGEWATRLGQACADVVRQWGLCLSAGIITTPLPLGAVAMLGLCVSMMTKTLPFSAAFSAFSNGRSYARAMTSLHWEFTSIQPSSNHLHCKH